MVHSPGIDRAREDVEAGRLWKARDRATGLFAARPTDEEVLGLTAEIYFRMGDLPRAATFWYLTEKSGSDVDQALAAMHERYPCAQDVIVALPIRDRIEAFPPPVQDRLHQLQRTVKDQTGQAWEPGPRSRREPVSPLKPASRLLAAGYTLMVALYLGASFVGMVTIVVWFRSGY